MAVRVKQTIQEDGENVLQQDLGIFSILPENFTEADLEVYVQARIAEDNARDDAAYGDARTPSVVDLASIVCGTGSTAGGSAVLSPEIITALQAIVDDVVAADNLRDDSAYQPDVLDLGIFN